MMVSCRLDIGDPDPCGVDAYFQLHMAENTKFLVLVCFYFTVISHHQLFALEGNSWTGG